ncbi:hypothetical protein [Haloterrigena salifodinae]|uniref:hypothetical protein n=1 Tax=Haloterrigena salifodinae TaxID=2675099 RepID=UPI000F88CF92|nr:hypothetical protein [Haloterrigena salifodinae]
MSLLSRLFGDNASDPNPSNYSSTKLSRDYTQTADETPGVLLQIQPHAENQGMVDAAGLLQSVHDVTTNFRGKNTSDHHSFELWFDGERIRFFMHAATEGAADKFRRRVGNNYANSAVFEAGGEGFPPLEAENYVAGARLSLARHYYYPIHHFRDGEGFERDPYGEITSEMLSTEDSTVIVQVAFRPEPANWADGGLRGESVDDVAESLRDGHVKGWINPRVREASSKEKQSAKIVEQQRGQQAFSTNIRVLAASPNQTEAEARARGVAGMFVKYYNATTEQGFTAESVKNARKLIDDVHSRAWDDRDMILTVDELASAAHIPNEEIETPRIDWKHTQEGARVPADSNRSDQR